MDDTNKITKDAKAEALKTVDDKDTHAATPVMTPSSPDVGGSPAVKKTTKIEKYASNDGTFVLSKLNDKTTVKSGNVMENQARHPAHQQHELAVEEDAAGYEQSASLYTARGSSHYDQGGSGAEVDAGKAAGQA